MKTFKQKTCAVIEYYREHGNRFAEVDGDRPVDEVTAAIDDRPLKRTFAIHVATGT